MTTQVIEVLIEHFGGLQRTADAFGVKAPSVFEWRKRGQLPANRVLDAERLTDHKFTRFQLRADIFGPAPAAGEHDAKAVA